MNAPQEPITAAEMVRYIAGLAPEADHISVEKEYDWRSDESFVRIGATAGGRRAYVIYQERRGRDGFTKAAETLCRDIAERIGGIGAPQ